MKRLRLYIFPVLIFITANLHGQTKFDMEAYSYFGREHNIFKGPEILYDLGLDEYLDSDTLIKSDYFLDFGYDLEYHIRKRRNYIFEVGNNFWYRRYSNHPKANQKKLGTNIIYEKYLSKKVSLGGEYEFSWNDKLGTSVSGDELLRSYKYIGNSAEAYLDYNPSKTLEFTLSGSYEFKKYYDDTTDMPLDHSNVRIKFIGENEFNKVHSIAFNLDFTDRNYTKYAASDKNGDIEPEYPKRHYMYYMAGISYIIRPAKGLIISSGFDYDRRVDMYEGYYSYNQISPNLKLRYMNKKFYVHLSAAYKQVNYDERYAYTFIEREDLLTYKYLKYNFKLKYKVLKPLELYLNFSSDNRDSNTELEHARTRRPYNNYEVRMGLNITLFDYDSRRK